MKNVILTERNEPEEGIVAQNCAEIVAETAIIWLLCMECAIIIASFLTELDSRVATRDQIEMEGHERGDYEGEN